MQSAERGPAIGLVFPLITHHSSVITACERRVVNTRSQVLLWGAQRISAMVLALCVIVHLVTIIYAVRNGLTAAEVLGRTRGNVLWGGFYALFVAAIAVHAPIGLRTIVAEIFTWRGRSLEAVILAFGMLLALWGWRAVYAVFVAY